MPDSEETLFKQQIQPAEWVSPKQAEMAKQVYSECLEKYRKIKCGDMDFPSDIVPYEVRLKAIENLVTKKDFKNFWIKANEYYVINIVSGLYTRYFGPDEKNLRPIITKITKTEKDRRLDEAAKLLKDFCRKIDSDQSLKTCFQAAFVDALEAGSLKPNNPYNESAFFRAQTH